MIGLNWPVERGGAAEIAASTLFRLLFFLGLFRSLKNESEVGLVRSVRNAIIIILSNLFPALIY